MRKIEGILYSNNQKIALKIEHGIIQEIEQVVDFKDADANKRYIAPGLIDNQVNGCIGIEFSKPDLLVTEMLDIVRMHRKHGVTTFMPTLITASHKSLLKSFANLSLTFRDPEVSNAVPGYHLEGPYISPEDGYRGAHSLKYVRKPNWDEFQELNETAEGNILQITLAPEIDGAIKFIKKCVQNNIVVALGHHNASSEIIEQAVDAGAKTVTHLGNGMANMINRFENPFWPQIADDRLMCSCILDGFHLRPEIVKVLYRSLTSKRIILTSDMTMLAGMPPGEYVWDGKDVLLTVDGVIMLPEQNCFAGASLPLRKGVENVMKYTGCNLREAIDMASKNPAKLYGLNDRGSIQVGNRSELILFNFENGKINITETVITND
ncbi:N-acetylglucosamine-6-phosphate deacetylase [Confluentibacter flavum]|uniref:N-acetylglucosamine-6-phosphate deacetylase n=1 Tax=Confluentibacter flavum TaxID=1909700 RepID=A0A2N3HHS7_9FLAO|nr:N-acetylglucosamine-6-phosphate deacetylase [Confluentibacter flavum]PKQ44453.1 N-acetylglucosamine-6-phosphate deacetylase [Confluentibacter flavum]